jgi:hypothetical protein
VAFEVHSCGCDSRPGRTLY